MFVDSELPDHVDFLSRTHSRIDRLGAQTYFRRAHFITNGNQIALLYGSEIQGGPRISYLDDITKVTDIRIASSLWENYNFDTDRDFRAVDNLSVIQDDNGTVFVTWSMFDRYGGEAFYEYDVYTGSVHVDEMSDIENWSFSRITLSDNIDHRFPVVNYFNSSIEISFIQEFNNTNGIGASVEYFKEIPSIQPVSEAHFSFLVGLALIIGVIFLFRYLINRIPEAEKEVEYMPHMINLKDSIEKY
jgi:hypothetical protein